MALNLESAAAAGQNGDGSNAVLGVDSADGVDNSGGVDISGGVDDSGDGVDNSVFDNSVFHPDFIAALRKVMAERDENDTIQSIRQKVSEILDFDLSRNEVDRKNTRTVITKMLSFAVEECAEATPLKDELKALHDQIDQLRNQLREKDQTIRGLKRQKDEATLAASTCARSAAASVLASQRHVEEAFKHIKRARNHDATLQCAAADEAHEALARGGDVLTPSPATASTAAVAAAPGRSGRGQTFSSWRAGAR
jgi:hypothetical protein